MSCIIDAWFRYQKENTQEVEAISGAGDNRKLNLEICSNVQIAGNFVNRTVHVRIAAPTNK